MLPARDLFKVCNSSNPIVLSDGNASISEMEEALAAHPLIGDIELLKKKFSSNDARAEKAFAEQGQVLNASDDTLEALARLNRLTKTTWIYFYCFCEGLESRRNAFSASKREFDNSTKEEFAQAVAEQTKICSSAYRNCLWPHLDVRHRGAKSWIAECSARGGFRD